ncbi:hypothetical protein Tco_0578834 [Tanacetum coccineum]
MYYHTPMGNSLEAVNTNFGQHHGGKKPDKSFSDIGGDKRLCLAYFLMDSRLMSLEHVKENGTFYNKNEYGDKLAFTYNEKCYSGFEEFQYGSENSVSLQYPVSSPFLRCS